jgi:hypothetical protein
LEEEIGEVLDARNRLYVLAPIVAAHAIAPPGQTGEQWVMEALALADEAHRLAKEEYGRCNFYHGPMDPDLVVENYYDQEWRERFKEALRQIEKDYQRVQCGLPKARQHLDRVISVVLPPMADTSDSHDSVPPDNRSSTTSSGRQAPRSSEERTADSKTDKQKQIQPASVDVRDLCHKLERELPKGVTQIAVAREFTGETEGHDPKAQSLLRQARRFPHLWKPADK